MRDRPNVFEHQQFRLRTPSGHSIKRTFRDIITSRDEPVVLNYPQEFFNIAALNLLSYLAQVAFEPEDTRELAERIRLPLSEDEYEMRIGPLRDKFRLDGPGPRFMQGEEPDSKKKPDDLSVLMMIAPKGDRAFLCRANPNWAVADDQAGLLLFMRNTFFEGTAGRGYQKGTNGDTPVRTLITIPFADNPGFISIRKSLWMNVVTRSTQQERFAGDYATPESGYDEIFWIDPPRYDIPLGGITLRSALGWMSATHWLHFENTDDCFECIVTGETISGRIAKTVTRASTGIAYGAKGDLESGVRAERFFRHPNVPTMKVKDRKTGDFGDERPFMLDRNRGLVDTIGSSFFGSTRRDAGRQTTLAPVVGQMIGLADDYETVDLVTPAPRLVVFGFHMLSNQRNVHGGYELDSFDYSIAPVEKEDRFGFLYEAEELMQAFTGYAALAAYHLQRNIHLATGVEVRAKVGEDGRIQVAKPGKRTSGDYVFGRDQLKGFWRDVQKLQHELIHTVCSECESLADLRDRRASIQQNFEEQIAFQARRRFQPVFEHQSTLPRTMPVAHRARIYLYSNLLKSMTYKRVDNDAK